MSASANKDKSPSRKVPITLRALEQRLKRRFARDGQTFHRTRGERWYSDLGYWHATENNWLAWKCDSLEDLVEHARDVGCLAVYEEVAS